MSLTGDGEELPPEAPLLMQSLRAVGYTTAAALADLVDNSIAAGARRASILFSPVPKPVIAVLDDGVGMNGEELVAAMRFGSRDPRLQRGVGPRAVWTWHEDSLAVAVPEDDRG